MSKKSSKATPNEVSSYEERDIVLGKVRGYPPWPGMIVNPEKVPDNVTKERPGKKSNFYCVRFFPTGDFAWLVAKDISKLQKHEIESYINEPHKRSGELLQGYRIALDPTQWEEEISKAPYISQDNEEGSEEVDQLEDDGESSKKGSKKRKRESDAASKAKKAPKSKASSTEGSKKKGRKSSKSKETVESEDEADGDAEPEETDAVPTKKASPPPAKKAKRDKEGEGEELDLSGDKEAVKVREWRHKLQKAFLGKAVPEPSEAPVLDELFKTVETYEGMTIQYLQFSKIGKVMRHITVVGEDRLTRNAEFHFRDRAKALVERWQSILGPSPSKSIGANGAEGVTSLTAPPASAANGAADKMDVSPEVTEPNGVNGTTAPVTEGISDADADAVGDVSLGDITMVES